MLCRRGIVYCACLIALWFTAHAANAAIVYGDLTGSTVTFEDITESSATDPVPLYGSPSVVGDTLVFIPTDASFAATAPKAVGANIVNGDVTDGRLTFTVRANQGLFLNVINLAEFGGYSVSGVDNPSANVGGVVFASFAFNNTIQTESVSFVGQDTNTNNPGPFTSGVGGWQASATLDLSQFQVTEAIITINNILSAVAPNGNGAAQIDKKGFTVEVTAIPEPAGLLLFGAGALLMITRRQRTTRQN